MTLYDKLRAGTVPKLLGKFKTGLVEVGRPVEIDGFEEWDAPTVTIDWIEVNALVTGVADKYVDGQTILMDDRQVLFQSPVALDVNSGDQVRVDGKVVAVVGVKNILAAGDPVIERLVIRG